MSTCGRPAAGELVVLVDEIDRATGVMEKIQAHRLGRLHRAFSVFVFDRHQRVLLQQRAAGKYHSAGLWANACCGHPRPDEDIVAAARRRSFEELGAPLDSDYQFSFRYATSFDNGLHENEVDHVFFGEAEDPVRFDPQEVQAIRWCGIADVDLELRDHPERFTVWLRRCWTMVAALRTRTQEHRCRGTSAT